MGKTYSAIYKRFLQKITDYKLLSLPEEDVEEILYGYLTSSVVKFRTIKSDLSKRDDESQCFEDTLLDVEIEILALQMVCEWVEPQLNNELYTKQFIGTKEEKFFAQSNHLEKLQTLRNDAELRSKKLRRDYSYQNSDYFKR